MSKTKIVALGALSVAVLGFAGVRAFLVNGDRDPNRNGATLLSSEPFRQWLLPGRLAFQFDGFAEVSVPTALTHMGQQKVYDSCLLLAGRSGNDGVLELFDITSTSVTLRQRLIVPQADFVGAVRGKYTQCLYVLERNQGKLYQAGWPVSTGVVDDATSWEVVASSANFSQLAPDTLDEMHLRGGEQPDGSAFIEVVPYESDLGEYVPHDRWGFIRSAGGAWSFMVEEDEVRIPSIASPRTTTGAGEVMVVGEPGDAFELVELDAPSGGAFHVRFSGALNQDGFAEVQLSNASLGSAYFARSTSTQLSSGPANICHAVDGANDALSLIDAQIAPFGNVGWGAFAGNDDFLVALRFAFGPTADASTPVTIPAVLLVGVEGASSIVDIGNGRRLLSGAVAVGASAVIERVDLPVVAVADLPLPDSAAGLNLQLQWVVVEGVEAFSVSEVCTVRVWGDEWSHVELHTSQPQ